MAVHLGSMLVSFFVAISLAGSGVNSQTIYGPRPGNDGSMLFTLSLPVSRRRLLFVRAGLGALVTNVLIAIMAEYSLSQRPGGASGLQATAYIARAMICTVAVYSLAVLLSCLLEVMWQLLASSCFWMAVLMLQLKSGFVAWLSPLRGMTLISYPLTAPIPWAPIVASLAFTGVCLCASVLVLQRKEY